MTTFPTIPVDGAPTQQPQGKPVKRGSTSTRARVLLDSKSRDRVKLVNEYMEREFGRSLSLSLVLRLALHNLCGNLATAAGAGDDLGKRIKTAYEGR